MVTILVGKGSNRRSITRHLRMTGVVGEFADRDGRLYLDYGIKGLGLVVGKLPKKPKAEKVVAESEK
ncbi:MAG: hypothetical protein HYT63_01190 [Candidatus Yanofskybacteria bacterium]|nr:hypothetical protein [Candidatus Yanofskybacteria bacterium]